VTLKLEAQCSALSRTIYAGNFWK